ncbi:MAG: ribbon-helix-helix protein, CopG family [Candidatus Xenobiia bacterium LiM19]
MEKVRAGHRIDCRCAICMRKRGEIKRLKCNISLSLSTGLIATLRNLARRKKSTISEIIEQASKDYIARQESVFDDEPITEEDIQDMKEAEEDIKTGRVKPWAQIKTELGL